MSDEEVKVGGGAEKSGVVVSLVGIVERPLLENSTDEDLRAAYVDNNVCNELSTEVLFETALIEETSITDEIVSDERFIKEEILGCTDWLNRLLLLATTVAPVVRF